MEWEVEERPQSHFQMYMCGRILYSSGHQTAYFQDTSSIWDRIEGYQQLRLTQSDLAKDVLYDVVTLGCVHL
jgi:hypothetical protein